MKLLIVTRDPLPTVRPDVTTLFGKYLPGLGVHSDIGGQRAAPGAGGEQVWGGGTMLLTVRHPGGRLRNHVAGLLGDLRVLARARHGYSAIQVRDKILVGVLGLLAARRAGVPFFYWMSYPIPEGDLARARAGGRSLGLVRLAAVWIRGTVTHWLQYRVMLPRADHVFVQSDAMLDALNRHGVDAARMTAVPMGVDTELLASLDLRPALDARFQGRRVVAYH